MPSDLLDVKESADHTHLKPSTIRAKILRNEITYVKLFGRVFCRRQDLDELIERSLVPARKATNGGGS